MTLGAVLTRLEILHFTTYQRLVRRKQRALDLEDRDVFEILAQNESELCAALVELSRDAHPAFDLRVRGARLISRHLRSNRLDSWTASTAAREMTSSYKALRDRLRDLSRCRSAEQACHVLRILSNRYGDAARLSAQSNVPAASA